MFPNVDYIIHYNLYFFFPPSSPLLSSTHLLPQSLLSAISTYPIKHQAILERLNPFKLHERLSTSPLAASASRFFHITQQDSPCATQQDTIWHGIMPILKIVPVKAPTELKESVRGVRGVREGAVSLFGKRAILDVRGDDWNLQFHTSAWSVIGLVWEETQYDTAKMEWSLCWIKRLLRNM